MGSKDHLNRSNGEPSLASLRFTTSFWTAAVFLCLGAFPQESLAQDSNRWFPDRAIVPALLAGPRDPVTSFSILGVTENPNAHGSGVEVEVSLGSTLPVLVLGEVAGGMVVGGLEAAVFGRFGLQVLERELIASDWVFATPVYWLRDSGWVRFRYFHSSSHMGDEYARRFEDPGVNFARDAAELLGLKSLSDSWEVYAGVRYAYIVHPEESKRWVARAGMQYQKDGRSPESVVPFLAGDLVWDQDAGSPPRTELKTGIWLPEFNRRRFLRVALSFLSGPSPLGQFNGGSTTQVGLGLEGIF